MKKALLVIVSILLSEYLLLQQLQISPVIGHVWFL